MWEKEEETTSTKRFYNEHVTEYIANIEQADVSHAPRQHATEFVNNLTGAFPDVLAGTGNGSPRRRFQLLEVGCGYGRDALLFCELLGGAVSVVATDYARGMLLQAQKRLPQDDGRVQFMELDMRQLAQHFLPDSFHGLWACATLIHIPKTDMPVLLQSFRTLLKPGGLVYISVKVVAVGQPNNDSQQEAGNIETFDPDHRYGGIRKFYAFYRIDEFLDYVRAADLEIVTSGTDDHRACDSYATHPFLHVIARKRR